MAMRSRNALAAILAAGVLVVGTLSTVSAHDPGHQPFPGGSAKPLPSGWAWPSDMHTPKVRVPDKSHPVKSPEPTSSHAPKLLQCPTPGTSPTPTPTPTPTGAGAASIQGGFDFGNPGAWSSTGIGRFTMAWLGKVNAVWSRDFCDAANLRKLLDASINQKTSSLQSLVTKVGKSGLASADQATIDGALNALVDDLTALKSKVDAETALDALQADWKTLQSKGAAINNAGKWVRNILAAQSVVAAGPKLTALENQIAAAIAAATPSREVSDAQLFLEDMDLAAASAQSVAGQALTALLALAPADVESGAAQTALNEASLKVFLASWDLRLARFAGSLAQHELKEASMPTPTPKPTPTPTPTPVPTPTPTPSPV